MNTDVVYIAIVAECRRHTIWLTVESERAVRVATYGCAATVSVAVGNSQRHGVLSGRVVGCFQQRWWVSVAPDVATRCARSDVGLLRFDAGGIFPTSLRKQGNNRVVINQNGVQVQANHYYPYGATMGEGLANSTQPYKYGGKELDTMNGLNQYDFGARQQDPALGIFTTIDPMAEKYPHISPYAYCAGNPILYVDPTGMDVWEINNQGMIINRIEDKTKDAFYMVAKNSDGKYERTYTVDDEGNKNYNTVEFDYGTIESQSTTKSNSGESYDTYQVRGDQNGIDLFKFMSNNVSNISKVEFSLIKTGRNGSNGLNFITTGHQRGKEPGMSYLLVDKLLNGYNIRSLTHSHPISNFANDGDYKFAGQVTYIQRYNRLKTPLFYIYHTPTRRLIQYIPTAKDIKL